MDIANDNLSHSRDDSVMNEEVRRMPNQLSVWRTTGESAGIPIELRLTVRIRSLELITHIHDSANVAAIKGSCA